MKGSTKNILLIIVLIIMITLPLLILKDAEFGGADGQQRRS